MELNVKIAARIRVPMILDELVYQGAKEMRLFLNIANAFTLNDEDRKKINWRQEGNFILYDEKLEAELSPVVISKEELEFLKTILDNRAPVKKNDNDWIDQIMAAGV
jgi:hypothetical protein